MASDSMGFRRQIRSFGLRQRLLKVLSFLGLKTYRSSKSLGLSDKLHAYAQSVSSREPDILAQLRQETAKHPAGMMQIAPEEGQFLALLTQLMGAKKTLEIGVLTGYSTLAVALALPANGKTVACDISEEFTAIARRYWQKAGVDQKSIFTLLQPSMFSINSWQKAMPVPLILPLLMPIKRIMMPTMSDRCN